MLGDSAVSSSAAGSSQMRLARTLGKKIRSLRLRTRNSRWFKVSLSLLLLTIVTLGFIGVSRSAGSSSLESSHSLQHVEESFEEAARRVQPEEFQNEEARLAVDINDPGNRLALAQIRHLKHDPRTNITYYPVPPERKKVFAGADSTHLHGKVGLAVADGRPLWTPVKPAFRMTSEQRTEAHKGYCFNTKVSASIALDRSLPEFNSASCLNTKYDTTILPMADIIIVFHNEDLSALLRSLHSILNRTPPALLGKIILVNDDSNAETHPWLFDELPGHIPALPKTELIHLTARRGLMMARMEGTKLATSPIAVYLDSHIECTERWLEPMLEEIRKDRKRIVTPMIHSIHADNFDFEHGAVGVVGFTWTLGQSHPYRYTNEFDPMQSPIMAGGLFAADRKWFADELGGYDPEMKLYGGEEMEIGFKTWQCGGSIYALPCSRVGHIFRTDKFWKGQVYTVPFEEIIRNKRRTAEVWMDDYKEIAFLAMSELPANMTLGPLEAVKAVRERLQCKPFEWYLKNVQPELWTPSLENGRMGSLNNPQFNACLDNLGSEHSGRIGVYPCHGHHGSQAYLFGEDGQIRPAQSGFKSCVVPKGKQGGIELTPDCDSAPPWSFEPILSARNVRVHTLKGESKEAVPVGLMKSADGCLAVKREETPNSPFRAFLTPCDEDDQQQRWAWESTVKK